MAGARKSKQTRKKTIMTKNQIARWNMGTSTHQALLKHESVYDGTAKATALPALEKAAGELGELLDEIEAQSRKQEALSGVTQEKAAALQALGDAAFEVAGAVHACAVASGNVELAGKVKFSRAEFSRGADKTIINRTEAIHEIATAVVESLDDYGVTQAKLDALARKIEAFRKAHPAPRQRVNASSAATTQLARLFPKLTALLRDRVDRLMVQFKTTSPDFFNEYQSARVIVDPATGNAAESKNAQPGGLSKAA
jgi:hypothetical protein